DSGASCHMLPDLSLLHSVHSVEGTVSLGNKEITLRIVGAGDTNLPLLGRTLLVPDLSYGLISIPSLDKIGCQSIFGNGKVFIIFDNEVIISGSLVGSLYYLDQFYLDKLCGVQSNNYPLLYTALEALEYILINNNYNNINNNNNNNTS